MKTQIFICSQDAVFARMLELEFSFHGYSVKAAGQLPVAGEADVVLLDLDSATAPEPSQYRRMIGFTRGKALSEDLTRRQCSMILHRPFDLGLLRREVFEALQSDEKKANRADPLTDLSISKKDSTVTLLGERIKLSPNEYQILDYFLQHRGKTVSRETLAGLVGESTANKTDVYVCYLRRKLAKVTPVTLITTVRNKGYVFYPHAGKESGRNV